MTGLPAANIISGHGLPIKYKGQTKKLSQKLNSTINTSTRNLIMNVVFLHILSAK